MPDPLPAIIARVETYSEDGILLETWHQVILGGVVARDFHGGDTYDEAHAWAMTERLKCL